MKNIKGYTLQELNDIFIQMGFEKYRAQQVFKWLWQRHKLEFGGMTDLAKDFRKYLTDRFIIRDLDIIKVYDAVDGAKKLIARTTDDRYLECVYIPEVKRHTVCVSTQIGCPLGCKFCATGLMGFERDLKGFEIANQAQVIRSMIERKITNIVFMGMGEPMLNLGPVFDALDIITSSIGLAIAQRHITISTIGLIDGIEKLLRSKYKVKLAISLNTADESLRHDLMPATRNTCLSELIKIAQAYSKVKGMITFEYVLIKNINDRIKDAKALKILLNNMPCKINIIPFNAYPGISFEPPDEKAVKIFYDEMLDSKFTVTLRRSKGSEIQAACGQLASMISKRA